MKVLVKTADLSREDWLRWRTKGIGGSDVSVIAGINPYRSIYQLWKEKTGQMEPEEEENEYTHFGTILEPIVKKEFMARTGLKVRAKKMILQSSEHPFMLADLDGVIKEDGKMCIFEAKTASAYKQEIWEKGVPEAYILQVQHYMAVTGAEKAHIAALVGGNRFYHRIVMRDDALIEKIIAMETDFWERCVEGGMEPVPDGSSATSDYLNALYGQSNGKMIQLPSEALAVFEQYDEVSRRMNELKAEKEAICNQFKNYLKENEAGMIGERRVSWKQVCASAFDKKRLEQEQPEVYEAYMTQNQYRRLLVA